VVLSFEPDRVVYDDSEHMIRIFALDGVQLVHCAVSKAALVALEDDALAGPHAMAVTYRRNQALVQEIAKRKYLARRYEVGNTIVVRLDDVNAHLAASKAAKAAYVKISTRLTPERQHDLVEAD
jgi:hypothetical protein